MVINNELINYFKKGIGSGYSTESLKKELLNSGWSEIDVDDSMKIAVNNKNALLVIPNFLNNTNINKIKRPILVSILAILAWIGAGSVAIQLIWMLIQLFINNHLQGVVMIIVLLPVYVGVFFFMFYYGKGLWNGKNGWRIFVIIMYSTILFFSLITILFLSSIIGAALGGMIFLIMIPSIAISMFFIWYMGYKKNVVEFFHQQ